MAEHQVDIDSLSTSINHEFQEKCKLYKAQNHLREQDPEAFTPTYFSIGPFHHHRHTGLEAEHLKQIYFDEFVTRFGDHTMQQFQSYVQNNEHRIRDCFVGMPHMSGEDFRQMLLMDACFLFRLLIKYAEEPVNYEEEIVWKSPCMYDHLLREITLLENQLPYFFLRELYSMIGRDVSFDQLVFELFKDNVTRPFDIKEMERVKHFTDLLRVMWLPPREVRERIKLETVAIRMPSAEQIYDGWLRFQKKDNVPIFHLKLKLLNKLEMSKWRVQSGTMSRLRNVIALESRCHPVDGCSVTQSVCPLKDLLKNPEDVDVLERAGVLEIEIGTSSNVVSSLASLQVSPLYRPNDNHLHVIQKVNKIVHGCWARWGRFIITGGS